MDNTYARRATLTHDTWGLPWSCPLPSERPPVRYRLPDGREIELAADLCKGALFVGYTLAGGKIVNAERID